MNKFFIGLIVFTSCLFFAFAEDSDVVTLTTSTFDDFISSNEFVLGEFYAPWCGHCKKLQPEWEKAATALKGTASLIKVDCTVEQDVCSKFGVSGYPTIKFFVNGEAQDYQGPRESAGIVQWVSKKIDPVPIVNDLDTFDAIREDASRVFAFEGIATDSEDFKNLKQAASSQAEVVIVVVADGIVDGLEQGNGKLLTPDGDFDFSASTDTVSDFIAENAFPLVEQVIDPATFRRYFNAPLPFALVWFDTESIEAGLVDQLKAYAEEVQDTFRFAWLDSNQWGKILPQVGASGDLVPTSVAWSKGEDNKAPLVWDESNPWTLETFKTWVAGILDGTTKTWQKSEAIPEENDGPVRVIVWKSFEDEVLNSGKNVLLEFYAPWCGHCKSLAPTYEELGEFYADNDDIVIAKIDATANHVPEEYGVKGFPTIKLFVPGSSQPIDFSGARTLDGFKEFLNNNSA